MNLNGHELFCGAERVFVHNKQKCCGQINTDAPGYVKMEIGCN